MAPLLSLLCSLPPEGAWLRAVQPARLAHARMDIGASIRDALLAEPGWSSGSGVSVQSLYDQCVPADEEEFFDAIDALEVEGWLRIQNGKTDDDDDFLFSTPASAAINPVDAERAAADALAADVALGIASVPTVVVDENSALEVEYDYEAEAEAVQGVLKALEGLKRFGVDKADEREHEALNAFCRELERVTLFSPAPAIRDDARLIGDWQLVGTSSRELAQRRGLTGLGSAPFTAPVALFYRFDKAGGVVAKEVLEFFGRPILLNELRGKYGFSSDGRILQEEYSSADMGGTRNSANFEGATATVRCVCVTTDGSMRLGCVDGAQGSGASSKAYFVYKRLAAGELDAWLEERQLPYFGGTVPTLSTDELRAAYPYLENNK